MPASLKCPLDLLFHLFEFPIRVTNPWVFSVTSLAPAVRPRTESSPHLACLEDLCFFGHFFETTDVETFMSGGPRPAI